MRLGFGFRHQRIVHRAINLIINCSSPRPRSIRRSIERSGRLTPCSSTSSASARRSGTPRPQRAALRARFGSRENREPLAHQATARAPSGSRLRMGDATAACRAYLRGGERTSLKPGAPSGSSTASTGLSVCSIGSSIRSIGASTCTGSFSVAIAPGANRFPSASKK